MPGTPPTSPRSGGGGAAPWAASRQVLGSPVDRHGFRVPLHPLAPTALPPTPLAAAPRRPARQTEGERKQRSGGAALPEACASWSVEDVGAVVHDCCGELKMADCSGLFVAHEVDGGVLGRLGPNDLALLCDGPGLASPEAGAALRKVGPRFRLHGALRAFLGAHGDGHFREAAAKRPSLHKAAEAVRVAIALRREAHTKQQTPLSSARSPRPPGAPGWSAKEAGLVVAHILRESEGEEDTATAVAEVMEQHHINGTALAHVTREELREMGDGGDSFGELKLRRMGIRLRLTDGLKTFLQSYGAHSFADIQEAVPALKHAAIRHRETLRASDDRDKAAIDALLENMSGRDFDHRLLHSSLDTRSPAERAAGNDPSKAPKKKQVVVPVFMTILVKKLAADRGEDDSVSLVGTLIQRPLLYDLMALRRGAGTESRPYFAMRVNEGETDSSDCFDQGSKRVRRWPTSNRSYLGRFPLVSADFWTSDHLSERSRSVNVYFGTRARGTATLKRR